MASHSNLKQRNCWSCEYYVGKRKLCKSLLGYSVDSDGKGTCSCKKSGKNGKEVSDSGFCSYYQSWGAVSSAVASIEQKKESDKIAKETEREIERQKEEARKERKALEKSVSLFACFDCVWLVMIGL